MTHLIDMDEAWRRIAERAEPLEPETLGLADAIGRVLATDITSSVDLPPFANSAMDGYALRSSDVIGASDARPARLALTETIAAGSSTRTAVQPGSVARIMTGAPLPDGADAVLQLENARLRGDIVEVRAPVPAGRHIRRRGEDIRAGALIAARGSTLTANVAALLANAGCGEVCAYRGVRAAVLATGSELVSAAPGVKLAPGQIFDSNGLAMRTLASKAGCVVTDLGIAGDDRAVISERIRAGLDHDLLLISGGVSVGRFDYVKDVLGELGMERVFWRVRMKPGKPLLCGRIGRTWIFGLPGNPISCVAGFAAFVGPLIRALMGHGTDGAQYRRAQLTRSFTHAGTRRVLATAWIEHNAEGQLIVTPTADQGSAMMHALAESNGFLVAPEEQTELCEGELVSVLATH